MQGVKTFSNVYKFIKEVTKENNTKTLIYKGIGDNKTNTYTGSGNKGIAISTNVFIYCQEC